jgi:hypothetical protein
MKNTILLFAIAILSISQSIAQDRLFFLNGDETDVKITEITSSEVKYKRMDNLDGPSFSTLKSELFMIKYANGDKEMITAQNAEPGTDQKEEYTTIDAPASSNSGSGLSSAVIVTDEPTSTSPSNVDKWGRTEAENRGIYKKKLIKGAILMGSSVAVAGVGAGLFAIGNNRLTSNVQTAYMATGAILVVGGAAILIAGAAIMGTSAKYKKRADQLANGSASISPVLLNDTQFSGAKVNSNTGFGINLTYNF